MIPRVRVGNEIFRKSALFAPVGFDSCKPSFDGCEAFRFKSKSRLSPHRAFRVVFRRPRRCSHPWPLRRSALIPALCPSVRSFPVPAVRCGLLKDRAEPKGRAGCPQPAARSALGPNGGPLETERPTTLAGHREVFVGISQCLSRDSPKGLLGRGFSQM